MIAHWPLCLSDPSMVEALSPPLNLRLPLATRSLRSLLLTLATKRFHPVKQPEECGVAAEDFVAHLPEVPRRSLASFRIRDRTSGYPTSRARLACV